MKFFVVILLIFSLLYPVIAQDDTDSDPVRSLIEAGEFENARNILRRQYVENDEDPQTNYWLAILALRDTLYDDAIDYLDVAIEGDDQNPDYYFRLGQAYAVKAQLGGAFAGTIAATKIKSNWEKVLELDEKHLQARISLIQFLLNAPGILGGDKDEAKKLAEDLIPINPAAGHIFLANYYWFNDSNIEKTEAEIQHSEQVKADEQTQEMVRQMKMNLCNRLGYYFLGTKDFDQSYKFFKWAIRAFPEHHNPYDSMGDYFTAVAVYDSALIYYEKALQVNPTFSVSLLNKAKTLEELGEKKQAKSSYQQVIEQDPESNYAEQAKKRLGEIE
jgi:tetratricopeptide (TPR) repeat protein